jgi:hypothetical protein
MRRGAAPEHKVIITGTGRAGTTFLVRLLTELGLDTGISAKNWHRKYYTSCNAGLEHNLLDKKTPYIVKNPALCDTLPAALATGRFVIDHAYIPIRELGDAAASRVVNGGAAGSVPGGLWGTSDPGSQRAVLAEMFHRLVHTLVVHEIPHTFILFPRMIADPDYCFGRLEFVLKGTGRDRFRRAFDRVADPALVHALGPGHARPAPAARPPEPVRRRGVLSVLGSLVVGGQGKPPHQ